MRRSISLCEKMFVAGLAVILLFMLLHDWVPLGKLNDPAAIRSLNTVAELISITAFNTVSIGIVIVLALWFIGKKYPIWARIWLVAHLGGILFGAVSAWWIPYFAGGDPETVSRYQVMFGNTHTFLPEMHGFAPNTIHVMFHTLLVFVWLLAIYISIRPNPKTLNSAAG